MKIINRKQFLALPEGVLYAKFNPCIFGDIAIKEESLSNDWYYQDLLELDVNDSGEWADTLFEGMEKGTSITMDFDCVSRDGLFDEEQLFAVFEKEDVISLIERLKKVAPNYPSI
jgi:hypothetical protein